MAIRGNLFTSQYILIGDNIHKMRGFSSEYILRGQTKRGIPHMVATLNCQSTSNACRRRMQKQ